MKYIVTFLSTTLFLSLMLHVAHYENIQHLQENEKISNKIISNMSENILSLELQIAE
jgi:hypothetical protein